MERQSTKWDVLLQTFYNDEKEWGISSSKRDIYRRGESKIIFIDFFYPACEREGRNRERDR